MTSFPHQTMTNCQLPQQVHPHLPKHPQVRLNYVAAVAPAGSAPVSEHQTDRY